MTPTTHNTLRGLSTKIGPTSKGGKVRDENFRHSGIIPLMVGSLRRSIDRERVRERVRSVGLSTKIGPTSKVFKVSVRSLSKVLDRKPDCQSAVRLSVDCGDFSLGSGSLGVQPKVWVQSVSDTYLGAGLFRRSGATFDVASVSLANRTCQVWLGYNDDRPEYLFGYGAAW